MLRLRIEQVRAPWHHYLFRGMPMGFVGLGSSILVHPGTGQIASFCAFPFSALPLLGTRKAVSPSHTSTNLIGRTFGR